MLKQTKKQKGITLIALVITVIVLLILAAVTINALSGDNGILKRASEAKTKTIEAQDESGVELAITEARTQGLGTVTDENLREALNKNVDSSKYTLEGDDVDGWDITVKSTGKTYHVNTSGNNSMYSEEVVDSDIAPADLFLYEVIDENAKTARIIGMNPKYCYKTYLKSDTYTDTNYEIIYNGNKISDTLVIPYKWTNNGDKYTITEACIYAKSSGSYGHPKVKTIIFPNTITKISSSEDITDLLLYGMEINQTTTKVVLPSNLKIIGLAAFGNMIELTNLVIPDSVEEIDDYAFYSCRSINEIDLTNIKKVGKGVFYGWSLFQKIKVPFESTDEVLPSNWNSDWYEGSRAEVIYKDTNY